MLHRQLALFVALHEVVLHNQEVLAWKGCRNSLASSPPIASALVAEYRAPPGRSVQISVE